MVLVVWVICLRFYCLFAIVIYGGYGFVGLLSVLVFCFMLLITVCFVWFAYWFGVFGLRVCCLCLFIYDCLLLRLPVLMLCTLSVYLCITLFMLLLVILVGVVYCFVIMITCVCYVVFVVFAGFWYLCLFVDFVGYCFLVVFLYLFSDLLGFYVYCGCLL